MTEQPSPTKATWPWLLIVVALTAASAGIAYVATAEDTRAEAILTLTDEVVWPFYDSVRIESRERALTAEFAAGLSTDASYDVVLEDNQSLMVVEVSGTGEEEALAAADEIADALVSEDLTARRTAAQQEADELNAQRAELVSLKDGVESGSADGDAGQLDREISALDADILDATTQAESGDPRLARLGPSRTPDDLPSRPRNALIGAIAGLLGSTVLVGAIRREN